MSGGQFVSGRPMSKKLSLPILSRGYLVAERGRWANDGLTILQQLKALGQSLNQIISNSILEKSE